jgi:hypothetical protein
VLSTPDAQADGLEGVIEGLRVILQYMAARRFIRDYKVNAEVCRSIPFMTKLVRGISGFDNATWPSREPLLKAGQEQIPLKLALPNSSC